MRNSPGVLNQHPPQVAVSLARSPRLPLARTLAIPRTESSPTGRMRRRRKLAHVRPEFGNQRPGGLLLQPRNRAQPANLILVRLHPFPDPEVERIQFVVQPREIFE